MNKIILFPRGKTFVAATVINTVLEPLETGNGKQVVFFCQDKAGQRYRVPKSQVQSMGQIERKARDKKCQYR